MEVVKTTIEGILLIKLKIYGDSRGYFVETWQQRRYSNIGINFNFVQDNHSMSYKGTLRGLHYQKKHPQGKLVMVSYGEVFDVAVDIRPKSPTFGKWYGAFLNENNQHQLWIAPGFAHGFVVLSEMAHFHYKTTEFYYPGDEHIIQWNDPEIGIDWPQVEPLIISDKDAKAPSFRDLIKNNLL